MAAVKKQQGLKVNKRLFVSSQSQASVWRNQMDFSSFFLVLIISVVLWKDHYASLGSDLLGNNSKNCGQGRNLLSNKIFYRGKYARSKGAGEIWGTKRKYLFSKLCNLIPRCFWSCFLSALPSWSRYGDFERSGSGLFDVFLVFVLFSGKIACLGKPRNLELRLERRKSHFQIFCFEKFVSCLTQVPPSFTDQGSEFVFFSAIFIARIYIRA